MFHTFEILREKKNLIFWKSCEKRRALPLHGPLKWMSVAKIKAQRFASSSDILSGNKINKLFKIFKFSQFIFSGNISCKIRQTAFQIGSSDLRFSISGWFFQTLVVLWCCICSFLLSSAERGRASSRLARFWIRSLPWFLADWFFRSCAFQKFLFWKFQKTKKRR